MGKLSKALPWADLWEDILQAEQPQGRAHRAEHPCEEPREVTVCRHVLRHRGSSSLHLCLHSHWLGRGPHGGETGGRVSRLQLPGRCSQEWGWVRHTGTLGLAAGCRQGAAPSCCLSVCHALSLSFTGT